jgi:hypothetical protein
MAVFDDKMIKLFLLKSETIEYYWKGMEVEYEKSRTLYNNLLKEMWLEKAMDFAKQAFPDKTIAVVNREGENLCKKEKR